MLLGMAKGQEIFLMRVAGNCKSYSGPIISWSKAGDGMFAIGRLHGS